jgi:hypothetical protein
MLFAAPFIIAAECQLRPPESARNVHRESQLWHEVAEYIFKHN